MKSAPNGKKVVLITGASGSLGKFVTEAFLEEDAQIAAVERHPRGSGVDPRIFQIAADLGDSGGAERVLRSVLDRFGRIDALAHLVGGFEGGKSVSETEEASLDRMLDLNLRPAFRLVRLVAPRMQTQGRGRIVVVASRTAVEPQAFLGAYGASKAALVSLMHTLALELKSAGVTVNVVLPGTMDTPANRAAMPGAETGTWVHPSQVARVIRWLASDDAAEISGALVPIYGAGM